jgi:hypothetical protein
MIWIDIVKQNEKEVKELYFEQNLCARAVLLFFGYTGEFKRKDRAKFARMVGEKGKRGTLSPDMQKKQYQWIWQNIDIVLEMKSKKLTAKEICTSLGYEYNNNLAKFFCRYLK